jgi:hypothetical protein
MRRKQLADKQLVQLAARVPASLLMKVKIHCVEREVAVMDFIADALREKLRRVGVRPVK